MKYCCLTAYYDRPARILEMIKSLSREVAKTNITMDHYILSDCSPTPLPDEIFELTSKRYRIKAFRNDTHMGRVGYWLTLTTLYQMVKDRKYDYYMHINDDMLVCNDFFKYVGSHKPKFAREPILVLCRDEFHLRVFKGSCPQSLDGAHIMPFEYLKALDFRVHKVDPVPAYSSGTWSQVSDRLKMKLPGVQFIYPSHSLLDHTANDMESSKMNPKDRVKRPMKSIDFVSGDVNFEWVSNPKGFHDVGRFHKKTLIKLHEGIGNMVQALPAVMSIISQDPHVDIGIYSSRNPRLALEFYGAIAKHTHNTSVLENQTDEGYRASVTLLRAHMPGMPEVESYIRLARDAGYAIGHREDEVLDYTPVPPEWFGGGFNDIDVLICNGGAGNTAEWLKKRYRRWHEVADALSGYKVSQIGLRDELIYGIHHETSPLQAIANAKVIATNDTAAFHIACAMGKKVVGWFGPSYLSRYKNAHPVFHERFATIIDGQCEGGGCFDMHGGRSERSLLCDHWNCTVKSPRPIIDAILEGLK